MVSPILHIVDQTLTETEKMMKRQMQLQSAVDSEKSDLFQTSFDIERVSRTNCENLIGSIEVPVGVAGPVTLITNTHVESILLPLATTEGALVASIQRGCKVINAAGGCQVFAQKVGMSRAPVFQAKNGAEARAFGDWIDAHTDMVCQACQETSHHLQYLSHQTWVRGRHVYIRFVFDTDEAMGMNMVTIALAQACSKIKELQPTIKLISLSSNMCTDKKDSVINRLLGRGYSVQAEITLTNDELIKVLKVSAQQLLDLHLAKNVIGSNLAGSFSQSMHVANVAAAIFLATGQDMAHVGEASQANLTIESVKNGLYIALNIPDLPIGTIGGGTWLPAQAEARQLIRTEKSLSALQLAEAIGVAALAGEISGLAALASNTLAQAHYRLGRTNT